jgi:predicted RNase H-like HicB family nuclease
VVTVTLGALIEQWHRETLVFFDGWPGCFVSAATLEEAMAAAPAAVANHLAWLTAHGLPTPTDPTTRIEVAEHLRPGPSTRGLRFNADLVVPSDEYLGHALTVGALACADLIDLHDKARPDQRARANPPGIHELDKSIADQLRHLAELDVTYAAALSDQQTTTTIALPTDPAEALRVSQQHVEATLRTIPASLRSRRFVRDAEEWTVAKVIRRRTGHLFEHYPAFQTLASS